MKYQCPVCPEKVATPNEMLAHVSFPHYQLEGKIDDGPPEATT